MQIMQWGKLTVPCLRHSVFSKEAKKDSQRNNDELQRNKILFHLEISCCSGILSRGFVAPWASIPLNLRKPSLKLQRLFPSSEVFLWSGLEALQGGASNI